MKRAVPTPCTVPGCAREGIKAHNGWCLQHLRAANKYGSPTMAFCRSCEKVFDRGGVNAQGAGSGTCPSCARHRAVRLERSTRRGRSLLLARLPDELVAVPCAGCRKLCQTDPTARNKRGHHHLPPIEERLEGRPYCAECLPVARVLRA